MSSKLTKKTGLSKGGAQRHRKILRDNIQGLTKPALRRLLRRAGVKRIDNLVYETLRTVIQVTLEKWVGSMCALAQGDGRKVLNVSDLEITLSLEGKHLVAAYHKAADSFKACGVREKKGKKSEESTRKHRFKSGTVALKEIKHYQKSDCLSIPKLPFYRFVKEISQNYVEKDQDQVKIKRSAGMLLQLTLEAVIVEMCENANLIAIHAGRSSLKSKDIFLARKIMGLKA